VQVVLLADCGYGRAGDVVKIADQSRAKWAVSAGLARFATVQDLIVKTTPAAAERKGRIKAKG